MNFIGSTISDKLVVNKNGQLRHIQVEKLTEEGFYRGQAAWPSDRIKPTAGLTFTSKPLGFKVLVDESIEAYLQKTRKKRRIEIEEQKKQDQWKKIVTVAESASLFIPIFGVVGVTCKILRAASTIAEVIQGADKFNEFITEPEKIITEEFLSFILTSGFRKALILDKIKINRKQKIVIETIRDDVLEKSKINEFLGKKLQVSVLGYSIDYGSANKIKTESDMTLLHINAFMYKYDDEYRGQSDAFSKLFKNFKSEQLKLGKLTSDKPIYSQAKY